MSIHYYTKVSEENLFFTSDTHFFHKKIIEFCKRPYEDLEEMHEQLILNWNNTVPKDGVVFYLGDFAFGTSTNWKPIIERLNGTIYFILGNHDLQNLRNLNHLENENSTCLGHMNYIKINEDSQIIALTHYPLLTYPQHMWNFHGHLHSSTFHQPVQLSTTQYDVGVDNNNYTPISYSKIKEIINNKINDTL